MILASKRGFIRVVKPKFVAFCSGHWAIPEIASPHGVDMQNNRVNVEIK